MTGAGVPGAVVIAGSGLAELTCARLLAGRGHRVRVACPAPAAGPRPLLLNGPALDLLDSLWGGGLLDEAWELREREVAWGGAAPARFAQPARVVDGGLLAARMRERLGSLGLGPGCGCGWGCGWGPGASGCGSGPGCGRGGGSGHGGGCGRGCGDSGWRVTARGAGAAHQQHGRRVLLAGTAPLAAGADERTARLATAGLGWVHLTPLGAGRCLAQAMVPGPAAGPAELLARLLRESGLDSVLAHPPRTAVAVPAAPRLHRSPAAPPGERAGGVLTVGAGALRCDPLSGTGTAQALRTGILAAAVIDAAAGGAPADALCAHYTARLRRAFREHLGTCARLYAAAFPGAEWRDEFAAPAMPPAPAPA
ncbi:hypothetical protein ACIQUQ_24925 [Streptomyces sp. NPDC101118]|uniref:hypothetical protein n=1 Tax=Streptomyces sp. NPDC101118 TaxID=3366109 RepID=UPI0037FB5396